MTERKPPNVSMESWVERQIHEAIDRGEFDNLPGAGKPLPDLGGADDENWWLRSYLRREDVPTEALLPTSLQLRKEIERLPETVRDVPTEERVRDIVAELNRRVMDFWRSSSGPQVPVRLVNAETVVHQWRAARSEATAAAEPADQVPPNPPPQRSRWWHRLARRSSRRG